MNRTEHRQFLNIKKSGENKQKVIFALSVCVCLILIYVLNRLFPLFAEDWDYAFFWIPTNDSPERLHSISDLIQSQYNHYRHWGGRNIAHGIDQILLSLNLQLTDILNSIVYILLCYTIYQIGNIKNRINTTVFILAFLGLWFLQPMFIVNTLWITYSANYIWTTLIIFAFIYPFYSYYRTEEYKSYIFKSPLFFILGIVAGWTNENMGFALLFFIITILILYKIENIKIPLWAVCALVGVIIGYMIMITAPGNYARLENNNSSLLDIFNFEILKERAIGMAKAFYRGLLAPSIIYALCLTLFIKSENPGDKKKIIRASLLFYATALAAYFIMLFSPSFARHSIFGCTALAIVAIAIIAANIQLKSPKWVYIKQGVISILLIAFCITFYKVYTNLEYINSFWKKREVYLHEEVEKGNKDIIFTEPLDEEYMYGIYGMYDLYDCTPCWINRVYARYYEVNTVRLVPHKKEK